MFLSGQKIKKAVEQGDLIITPFIGDNVKPASYTLTLDEVLNDSSSGEEIVISPDGYKLAPGALILGRTMEVVNLNNKYLCILGTRGSIAQLGIDALQSSIIAEPDSNNQFTLEISNRGAQDIILKPGIPIVKAVFSEI